ncbi:MAG: TlpA disulfide reductase family protein [Candidatus Binatia bacterium]|nr:TlpA disulfide reductase family protein [Candidatus Binatia bacterium]MDG1959239.1 TlpA disulfide reductase family protein [Candidatus Binatia bacterium]MDG2011088.1 TlpA disulfide reductase family protein [Candidatus Binatia bacterium]
MSASKIRYRIGSRWIALGGLLLGLLAAAASAQAEECRPIPEGTVGNYLGRDMDRNDVLLESMRDKFVVVSFWASYCPPCREELPLLSSIQRQVGSDELQVVAINFDEDMRTLRKAYRSWKGWGDILLTRDSRGRAADELGVSYIPTTLVFDPRGNFIDASCGFTMDGFKKFVGRLNEHIMAERRVREKPVADED